MGAVFPSLRLCLVTFSDFSRFFLWCKESVASNDAAVRHEKTPRGRGTRGAPRFFSLSSLSLRAANLLEETQRGEKNPSFSFRFPGSLASLAFLRACTAVRTLRIRTLDNCNCARASASRLRLRERKRHTESLFRLSLRCRQTGQLPAATAGSRRPPLDLRRSSLLRGGSRCPTWAWRAGGPARRGSPG